MADSYVGEIRIFASGNIPDNWMACNGQQLNVSQYPALFSLIGTVYGGNGSSTFNLPNLQGKLVAGVGQGQNLSSYTLGQTFGSYSVTLTADQTAHTHNVQASTDPASSVSPQNNVFATSPTSFATYVPNNTGTTLRQFDPAMLTSQGAGQAHLNVMPSLAFSYIICVNGIYPDFNY